ncbi:ribosomal protein L6 [Laetiporus sulphureus 93-53]|uniref:Ribosomal protein L6 n=1 Tax=Laetiporus sulphureus 93-53 TaxID=1314785 RepID=A0A165HPQ6_9APHY|nr:ribosomal protein L6 [Laetiporus sulphureus 93-53]KZT12020.1 ribosomal protein L6 [Laetiporus sulphureus 93-53]
MVLRQGIRHFFPSLRSFSSSAVTCDAHISNIGKVPIKIPPGVTLTPSPTALSVQGPLGTTTVHLHPFVQLTFQDPNTVAVTVDDSSEKKQRSMWGTTRTFISNAIVGTSEGFKVPLNLVGVGYRAALEEDPRGKGDGRSGQRLSMKLGYSHVVYIAVPENIKAEVPQPTKIILSCIDKYQVGQFAADIRRWRKPEPYKGKGIFVGDEVIRIKTVKKK